MSNGFSRSRGFEFMAGLVFVLIFGAILSAGFAVAAAECSTIGEMSGRRTEWKVLGGCFVEVKGRLIPKDSWRGEEDR